MKTIQLTAKRQATLPKALCEEMNLKPGDALKVSQITVKGKSVWCLLPADKATPKWFGKLKGFAKGKRHDMESVRNSINRSRKRKRT